MAKKPQPKIAPLDPAFSLLKSEGFKRVIQMLENEHPIHKALSVEASLEQRALKQCSDQEYERILQTLKKWSTDAKSTSIESTYEQEK